MFRNTYPKKFIYVQKKIIPQSPYPLPTCKGRTSGEGKCFHKTPKKKKNSSSRAKIAKKCNDRFRKHPLHQQLNKGKALKSQSEVT